MELIRGKWRKEKEQDKMAIEGGLPLVVVEF